MKKIGFIDYFLNEWHADNYPNWIKELSGGAFEVAYAYGKINPSGKMTNEEWSEKNKIQLLSSIDEVVEKSDYLVVLSPDNPEMHEELCEKPLASGKRTYVDKTFAPDRASALRIFEQAQKHNTPVYSTSALRYADEYQGLDKNGIDCINSFGPGRYENYSIHQVEPIVLLMGSDVKRIMAVGTSNTPALLLEFGDGRRAQFQFYGNAPFQMAVNYNSQKSEFVTVQSEFFKSFIVKMIDFFKSGKIMVSHEDTITVMSVIEHGCKALANPGTWVSLP